MSQGDHRRRGTRASSSRKAGEQQSGEPPIPTECRRPTLVPQHPTMMKAASRAPIAGTGGFCDKPVAQVSSNPLAREQLRFAGECRHDVESGDQCGNFCTAAGRCCMPQEHFRRDRCGNVALIKLARSAVTLGTVPCCTVSGHALTGQVWQRGRAALQPSRAGSSDESIEEPAASLPRNSRCRHGTSNSSQSP